MLVFMYAQNGNGVRNDGEEKKEIICVVMFVCACVRGDCIFASGH